MTASEPALARDVAAPCLVCGGALAPSNLSGLLSCSDCGFVTADVRLAPGELEAIYGKDYFHGAEYRDYAEEERSLRLNFRDRIATLATLLPPLATVDVFEVGCAYGYFLEEMSGKVRNAAGIDISTHAIAKARERGLAAIAGDYLSHRIAAPVDLVAMWDAIEHVEHPDRFVRKAASDLKPGGLFALTTGDIGSLNARLRGRRWRMIHPPTHLHYFSVATVSRLLDAAGFDVVHVSHPGNSRELRSILHFILALRLGRDELYRRVEKSRLLDLRLSLNLFDIMFVVARRRAVGDAP